VEGGDHDAVGQAPGHAGHPFAHLPGGLVGEGHRQDVLGRDAFVFQQMDDAGGDDLGLAGTGPGQDQQGAFGMVDRLPLRWIESFHALMCSTTFTGDANGDELGRTKNGRIGIIKIFMETWA